MSDPIYVAARSVLLDAFEALSDHLGALVLVGAQAVYLRAGEGDLSVAPYTADGDLAIDPDLLKRTPDLAEAMGRARFQFRDTDVGRWWAERKVDGKDVVIPRSISLSLPQSPDPADVQRPWKDTRNVQHARCLVSKPAWWITMLLTSRPWTPRTNDRVPSAWRGLRACWSQRLTRSPSARVVSAHATRTLSTCIGSFAQVTRPMSRGVSSAAARRRSRHR